MATAEELLLQTAAESSTDGEATEVVDKTFYIDVDSRTIQIPKSVTQLGVESDDDVKIITFSMPRYYYDSDLSEFQIYINYLNAKKEPDQFKVFPDTVTVGEDTLVFPWKVGRSACAYKGKVIFNVCLKKIPRDENGDALRDEEGNVIVEDEFNTTIATLPVLEGLETGEEIAEQYIDILMQWEEALFGAENSIISNIEAAGAEQRRLIVLKGDEVLEALTEFSDEKLRAIILKGDEVTEALTALSTEEQRKIVLKGDEVIDAIDAKQQSLTDSTDEALQTIAEEKAAVTTEGEEQRRQIILKGSEVLNTLDEKLPEELKEYMEANPPASHYWDGTVLYMTTAGGGTTSSDLKGEKGDQGTGITILGSYDTEELLRAEHPTGNIGEGYLVVGELYVWSKTLNDWDNVGNIQGPAGVSPTVSITKVGKVTTITITDATGPHTATIVDGTDGTGAGDMLASTYDTDGDGVVDDAAKLGGQTPDYYKTLTATDDGEGNITIKIGG